MSAIRLRTIEQWSGRDGFSLPDDVQPAGAILSLLAFGVVWPSGAQAAATTERPLTLRGAAYLELLAQAGALSVPIDEAYPPAPVPPCAGMRCSNDPAPAPPARLRSSTPPSSGAT